MATRLERASATGLIQAGPLYLKSVVLTPAAAAATASLQDTAAGGGTDVLSLAAAASGNGALWVSGDPDGVYFGAGLYLTLSGAGALVSVEYEQ
jgi:hypothetical protein